MLSIARTLLAVAPLFVSGVLATSDHNIAQTCGVFAQIGSGFNNDTLFFLTAVPFDQDPVANGTNLAIGALTATSNPVLLVPPTDIFATVFNLTEGTIFATDSEADLSFTAAFLTNGSDVSFIPTECVPLDIPQFCAIADTDPDQGIPFPTLAVNGTIDGNFALCGSTIEHGTQIVVFRPDSGSSEYDFSTCEPVNILLTGP